MHTNNFSIEWLRGLHFSSSVFKVIRTILSLFQKRKLSQNQPTKPKQANKKQQRQQFSCTKTSKRRKIVYFAFFFYLKSLLKKTKIVLITSNTLLLGLTATEKGNKYLQGFKKSFFVNVFSATLAEWNNVTNERIGVMKIVRTSSMKIRQKQQMKRDSGSADIVSGFIEFWEKY